MPAHGGGIRGGTEPSFAALTVVGAALPVPFCWHGLTPDKHRLWVRIGPPPGSWNWQLAPAESG